MTSWLETGYPHIWLPYAQMQTAPVPLPVVGAEGCEIILDDGTRLLDGIASWWAMSHGYQHPRIVEAIQRQAGQLAHVMFAGLAHEPAYALAERLCSFAPQGLSRVFFADSGSIAVEVALKMAVQYWTNLGKAKKQKIIGMEHGYHGDTFGTMAVSARGGFHKAYDGLASKQYHMAIPTDEYTLAEFADTLVAIAPTVAALIIEPLVQGAGGMRFHSADILAEIRRICREHEVLFIADEIMTGFYRTGSRFACDEAGITPDILCLGKALTGGHINLGATLATESIFEAFLSADLGKALMHGPTFMANPLACAAALASLELFENHSSPHPNPLPKGEGTRPTSPSGSGQNSAAILGDGQTYAAKVEAIETLLHQQLSPLSDLPGVRDVRVKGAIGVVQIDATQHDMFALRPKFIERGVWLRPFNDCVYILPPLVVSEKQLSSLTRAVCDVVRNWSRQYK